MPRKVHMLDQVGANKVAEIMHHYDQCSMEMWSMKFAVIGWYCFGNTS